MDASGTRAVIDHDARADIGRTLHGDILEIGPGNAPFPTEPGARVTYADRSVEGGRDATWPELVGQPWGPESDLDLDLDADGLRALDDEAFDVVIASHLIEHVANPIEAMREFERVLRPGGRLVLIVPDRTRTFDSVREPTSLAHLLDDFERHVTEVDLDHIAEFCEAIFGQPPFHPDEVRAWYDPSQLDDARVDLHRRRSIHVHCWTPEEFAAVMAALLGRGILSWDLVDLYFFDDAGAVDNEFGLVLERPHAPGTPREQCDEFVRRWASRVLERSARDPRRLIALQAALRANLTAVSELKPAGLVLDEIVGGELIHWRDAVASCEARLSATTDATTQLTTRLRASEERLEAMLKSRSYRFSRAMSAGVQLIRGVTRRSAR